MQPSEEWTPEQIEEFRERFEAAIASGEPPGVMAPSRASWRTGLQITALSAFAFVMLGVVPLLTWIVAPDAPWGLLAAGVPGSVLSIVGILAGLLVMRRDPVGG